jgi:protease I
MMLKGKKVALLVEDLYQELEVWYLMLRFREEGAEVTVVGSGSAKEHTGKFGYPVRVDKFAHEVKADQFDAVVVPGGYAPDLMRRYPAMVSLVREAAQQERWWPQFAMAAGCWLPRRCSRTRRTGFFAIKDELVHAGAKFVDEEVVVDGKIVTSRKPENLPAFCRAIIAGLGGALRCPSCHAVIYGDEPWD